MRKHILLAITLLVTIFCLLPASEVQFGERPFIDIYDVGDEAMEKGKLKIKLKDDYSEFGTHLENRDGSIASFGISELDDLNRHFRIGRISRLFDLPVLDGKHARRHREWGLHLWFVLQVESYEDAQMFDMAFYQIKAAYEEPVAK